MASTATDDFALLMARVRAGDQDAATELVRRYEPEVRRVVHLQLSDSRLRRALDTMDVCQSVLANFFARAAAGQFDLSGPEQLVKLLVTMARNKLRDRVRRERRARRDERRLVAGDEGALEALPGHEPTPSRVVGGQELLEAVRHRLSGEERYLAEQRALGRDWADLAAERGSTPEALRKRLARRGQLVHLSRRSPPFALRLGSTAEQLPGVRRGSGRRGSSTWGGTCRRGSSCSP